MAKLKEPVKLFIVQHLACYDSPQTVADAVLEQFGVKIDRRQVEEYDPEKRRSSKKWRALHAATRKAFEDEVAREPATLRAVRVRRLARMAQRAEDRKNFPLAAGLYEQIAKEDGGMFTNKRQFTIGEPEEELAKLLGIPRDQVQGVVEQLRDGGAPP